jgi:ATP-dependent Lon protease
MSDNEHKMLTRSKRKKGRIELQELKELEFSDEEIDNNENLEIKIEEEKASKKVKFNDNDSDIDEHGNVKDLIDYNFFEPITVERNNEDDEYNIEDDEYDSFDSEDYEDDEELLIGKLLSKYINKQISNNKNELSTEFKEVLSKYNNQMIDYFETLEEEQQKEIVEIEKEIDSINSNTIPLRFQILKSKIDTDIKAIAVRKLETLQNLDSNSNEYHKIKGWVDGLLKIPFGIYKDLPISIKNTHTEITNYLVKANHILNNAVHGHKKAKCQILQIVSQWISNPRSKGSVFAIVGPMGNGKTTLVKEGIAKMIDRPFQFISLGGATEANFFDGHSYTYEGSQPGKIVDILQKSKCMNPVIYFDELDKVSETAKGEEIINLLIHMTDFSQNDHFIDKYYNNIPLDLSKALFIFSLNDMERVNPILRDRMYMIHTNKLELDDKITISQNYLIPNLCREVALNVNDIEFSEEIIKFIIENYSKEEGVRNLRRTFETILSKLNIIRITKSCNIKDLELPFEIDNFSIPIKIDEDIVKKLVDIGKTEDSEPPYGMYT